MLRKILELSCIFSLMIFLAQFSAQQSSVTGWDKPMVNFYGRVVDKNGNEFKAENITISGAYKQIVMYTMPPHKDMTPSHRIKIDLAEEREIKVPQHENQPKVHSFKNREYIEIELISNDTKRTRNSYIIEKNRKLYFDEPTESEPKEHEVSFLEIEKVFIDGYKDRDVKKNDKK